jgi:hypothetical protein
MAACAANGIQNAATTAKRANIDMSGKLIIIVLLYLNPLQSAREVHSCQMAHYLKWL